MADQDKCVLIFIQITLQPFDMFRIQIVGRLIQQQNIGLFPTEVCPAELWYADHLTTLSHHGQADIHQSQSSCHFLHFGIDHIEIMHSQQDPGLCSPGLPCTVQLLPGGISHFVADFIHLCFHIV